MEELSALRELKLRLEEPQAREATELPLWALRDERFRCLLREAQRQVRLTHRVSFDLVRQHVTVCCSPGKPKQAGAASGGGGGEEDEEGFQRSSADEGAESEGAPACADIQVGTALAISPDIRHIHSKSKPEYVGSHNN